MSDILEHLPIDVVGRHVLGCLNIKDLVMFERAAASKTSHQYFLQLIPYCPSLEIGEWTQRKTNVVYWFNKYKCSIKSLLITLPDKIPVFDLSLADHIQLDIVAATSVEELMILLDKSIGNKIDHLVLKKDQQIEILRLLGEHAPNIIKLHVVYARNYREFFTDELMSFWKLQELMCDINDISSEILILVAHHCSELRVLYFSWMVPAASDDASLTTLAQHCPKLKILLLSGGNFTYVSWISLSECCPQLESLTTHHRWTPIPLSILPRCAHALSCIHRLNSNVFTESFNPYMTGLGSLTFDSSADNHYVPQLVRYCRKLTSISVASNSSATMSDLFILFRANPHITSFDSDRNIGITDAELTELVCACPNLQYLYISMETHITDIGVLALSEHCPGLRLLHIQKSNQVTESALLHLLKCCCQLKVLGVSRKSLSDQVAAQLPTKIRVIRP